MGFRLGVDISQQIATLFAPPAGQIDLGDANNEGASGNVPRADHTHGFPGPTTPPPALDAASAAGASSRPARQDHTHTHTTAHHLGGGHADLTGEFAPTSHVHPALDGFDTQGLFSARPAAGNQGATYYATDQDRWYRDDGAAWHPINAPTFHVADFGAAGDGATIDTAAIQATIDAAAAAGGGMVMFRPGTYVIDDFVTLPSLVSLIGTSRGATTIQLEDLATGGIKTTNFDALQGTGANDGVQGFLIAHLTIDGNRAGAAVCDGLSIYGAAYEIDDVMIHDCSGKGLWTIGNGGGGFPYGWIGQTLEPRYTRLTLQDNAGGNWWHGGPNDAIASHVVGVLHNLGASLNIANLYLYEDAVGSGGSALQLSDAHLWGSNAQYQIHAEVSTHRFTNIVLEGAWDAQWFVDTPGAGGIVADGMHIFGQSVGSQKGILVGGLNSAHITARIGGCPDGALILNGLGGTVGGGNGDFGRNVFDVVTDDDVIGALHRTSVLRGADGTGGLPRRAPAAIILKNTATTIPTGAAGLAIPWNVAGIDDFDLHDPADPTKLLVHRPGLTIGLVNVRWATSFTAAKRMWIRRNGAGGFLADVDFAQDADHHQITWLENFAAGDYIECFVSQQSGAGRDLVSFPTVATVHLGHR